MLSKLTTAAVSFLLLPLSLFPLVLPPPGTAEMKIHTGGMSGIKVDVFLDTHWPEVYEKDLSCNRFEEVRRLVVVVVCLWRHY